MIYTAEDRHDKKQKGHTERAEQETRWWIKNMCSYDNKCKQVKFYSQDKVSHLSQKYYLQETHVKQIRSEILQI